MLISGAIEVFSALLAIYTFVMVCISTLGARENSIIILEEQFWAP